MVHQVITDPDAASGEGHKLSIKPLSEVDLKDAAARLKSRGDGGGDNIFEILPRVSISGEDDEDWKDHFAKCKDGILALTGGGDVTAFAVGPDLIVFEKDKDEPYKKMHFPSNIDFIVWRRSILLVGLSSSAIILVDPGPYVVKYTWKPIQDLEGDKRYFVDAFIHSNPDPTKIDVVVVSVNGLVVMLRDVSLADGSMDSTFDQNQSLDIDLGTVKDISTINLDICSEITSVASPSRNILIVGEKLGQIMTVFLNENPIPTISVKTNIAQAISPELKKMSAWPTKIACFEGLIFVLLSNGSLEIFSGISLFATEPLLLPVLSSHVYDFKLVLNNNEGTVKLWALYKDSSEDKNYLGIFNGPWFTPDFIFQLPTIEDRSFDFKFPTNFSPFEEPNIIVEVASIAILLHRIMETSTDVTLQKLLARRKYLEALELATNYKKNLDIVKEAQARDKLSKILSYSGAAISSAESEYKSLLEILRSIKDPEFICNFCVNAQLQRLDWVKEILRLAKERVPECSNTSAAKNLLLALKKLYTFELVYPNGSINEWNVFNSEDNTMFLQSVKFLQNGAFDKCEKVWMRHSDEFISTITLTNFLPFFNILFDHQLASAASVSLVKAIMPFTIEKVATAVLNAQQNEGSSSDIADTPEYAVFISIVMRQVTTLEGRVEWPLNALKFVQELRSVIESEIRRLETCRTELPHSLQNKLAIVDKIRSKLQRVEQVLNELAELKKNHSIRILFEDYTKNDILEVVNKLLGTLLSKEEVENFVTNYFRPYAERKRLNVDHLFSEHVKSVLQKLHYYIQTTNIPHEERIICLVHLMSSTQAKLECTLEIATEWPVPWTPGIDNLVKQILDTYQYQRSSLSPDCVRIYDTIKIQREQVPFRCVVNKYKLNASKLLVSSSTVTTALHKILRLKKPGYEEDCNVLLKHVPNRDGVNGLEYLKFTIKFQDLQVSLEDLFPDDLHLKPDLKEKLTHRVEIELENMENIEEFSTFYSKEEQQRFIDIYAYLVADSDDPKKITSAKLKRFLPTSRLKSVYDPDFPYSILASVLGERDNYSKGFTQLLQDCKTLANICHVYLPDLLLACAAYPLFLENQIEMVWNIVEYIVNTPLTINMNNEPDHVEILQNASSEIAQTLQSQSPSLSLEQMNILHGFLCKIQEFEGITESVGQLLNFHQIFLNLKEQEIPLENDFAEIYKWLSGEQRGWEYIKGKFIHIGETLIKFGETDLYNSICKAIEKRVLVFIQSFHPEKPAARFYCQIMSEIGITKKDLMDRVPKIVNEENDYDSHLKNLVTRLNDAGIRVNLYALKQRNKSTLLKRLLTLNGFILAADLAVAFAFYEEREIWSQILSGCITLKNIPELRRILETIRNVPELWMLQEFAEAWKNVSKVDNNFLHLCPIPLD